MVRYDFTIFLTGLIIFLIRIPPLVILPIYPSLLNTHSIARYLMIFFLLRIFINTKKKLVIKRIIKQSKIELTLIAFYFVTQSISVLTSINIIAFVVSYKNILFSILLYFLMLITVETKKHIYLIVKILVSTEFINIGFQFIVIYLEHISQAILYPILYKGYLEVLVINYSRNRYFIDMYGSALIPIFFIYLVTNYVKQNKFKILLLMSIISANWLALVSNFRSHLIMAVLSTIISIIIIYKNRSMQIVILLMTMLVVSFFLLRGFNVENALQRIINPEEYDYQTVISRFYMWQKAIDISLTSPLLGVGLGNYYDWLSNKRVVLYSLNHWKNELTKITLTHPHNIFVGALVQTGLIGLLLNLFLIIFFLKRDVDFLNTEDLPLKMLILSFWVLFMFTLFNPGSNFQFLSLFWLLRALINKYTKLSA